MVCGGHHNEIYYFILIHLDKTGNFNLLISVVIQVQLLNIDI